VKRKTTVIDLTQNKRIVQQNQTLTHAPLIDFFYKRFMIGNESSQLSIMPRSLLLKFRLLNKDVKRKMDDIFDPMFLFTKNWISCGDFAIVSYVNKNKPILKHGTTTLKWALEYRFTYVVDKDAFYMFKDAFMEKNEIYYKESGEWAIAPRVVKSEDKNIMEVGSVYTNVQNNKGFYVYAIDPLQLLKQTFEKPLQFNFINGDALTFSEPGTIILEPIKSMTTKREIVHIPQHSYHDYMLLENKITFQRDITADIEPNGIIRIYDKSKKTDKQLAFRYPIQFFKYVDCITPVILDNFRFVTDHKTTARLDQCFDFGCSCPKHGASDRYVGSCDIDYIITIDLDGYIKISSYLHPETYGELQLPEELIK
jgi:hypothetical protein